jgi:hypothetical protein
MLYPCTGPQAFLIDGMESQSQAKVGSALQVFFNLEALNRVRREGGDMVLPAAEGLCMAAAAPSQQQQQQQRQPLAHKRRGFPAARNAVLLPIGTSTPE